MRTEDRIPAVAWTVFGILVVASALAVVVSYSSGPLAIVIVLAGVAAGNLLAWAARPPAGASARAEEPSAPEHRRAA